MPRISLALLFPLLQLAACAPLAPVTALEFELRSPASTKAFLAATGAAALPAGEGVQNLAAVLAQPERWREAVLILRHEFITDVSPPGAGRRKLVLHWRPEGMDWRRAETHRYGGFVNDRRGSLAGPQARAKLQEVCQQLLAAGWGRIPARLLGKEVELRGNQLELSLFLEHAAGRVRLDARLPFGADEEQAFDAASERARLVLGAWPPPGS